MYATDSQIVLNKSPMYILYIYIEREQVILTEVLRKGHIDALCTFL